MIPSSLLVAATALTSFLVVNGAAVVDRQATFTFVTPQSTSPSHSATPTTVSSSGTTSGTVPVSSITSSGTVPVSSKTETYPPTSSATVVPPVTKTSSSPSPSGTTGGGSCNGIQQWQAAFAYTAGDQVIYNGQLYTAKQWTYNNAPPSHPDQWTAGGNCAQPINNQANCNGVGAWQSNVAYTSGNHVTYNGHLWSAVQWTESNAPGDTSGTWKDLGACA